MSQESLSRPLERIKEAVSHLLKPPLSTLPEEFFKRKEAIELERSALEARRFQIREEGTDAAIRLMQPDQTGPLSNEVSYFNQVVPYRG